MHCLLASASRQFIGCWFGYFQSDGQGHTIRPSEDHCGCIVDLLAQAGSLSDASEFVTSFMEKMGPNAWRALLSGCRLHGQVVLLVISSNLII